MTPKGNYALIFGNGQKVGLYFHPRRLSTIRSSELILVMHKGRLEEQGSHQDLMAAKGRYATLYRQQEASS